MRACMVLRPAKLLARELRHPCLTCPSRNITRNFAVYSNNMKKHRKSYYFITQPKGRLIIPGGESTVQGKLLRELDLFDGIKSRIESGMPVYGTCAGLILLAKSISNDSAQHLQTMSIVANRNAYGRQLGSFHTEAQFEGIGDVQVLSEVDGKIVAARQKNQLVTAFHPELDGDTRVHEYFLNM